MGTKLFGVDIAKIVAQKIGPGLLDCTLIRVAPGTREAGNLAGGTQPTTTSYACKGFEATLEQRHIDGDLVKRTDVMVVLLGDTIEAGTVVPRAGDRVTSNGVTRSVIAVVDRDAAAASWSLAVRGP